MTITIKTPETINTSPPQLNQNSTKPKQSNKDLLNPALYKRKNSTRKIQGTALKNSTKVSKIRL